MATHPSPAFIDSQKIEEVPLRFGASTFGKFLAQVREEVPVTREPFVKALNEIIVKNNEHLPKDKQVRTANLSTYGKLERGERYPEFEELEPLYQAFSKLLPEPFSSRERDCYLALAQARCSERRPKKGYAPTAKDWQDLRTRLASFEAKASQKGKAPYLLPVPSASTPPLQIRISTKVVSLLTYDTSHVIERDQYVEEMMRLWDDGKRLIITKAISGAGKTRAFYLLLKRIARMQNRWPFYYALSSTSSQTPDDHLDSLLSLFSSDLRLSSPEDEHLSREERMEQIFTELARCSEQGLRLAVLVDDAHLLLDPSSGVVSAAWQHFFDLWIAHEHTAMLCLATREWPHWRGRDRSFLEVLDLEPLSPKAGATIWKRFGFGDVPDTLLEQASRKCGGYPQWIELRASDLDQPLHQFLWPRTGRATFTQPSADNQHTARIRSGHMRRIQRVFDNYVKDNRGKPEDGEHEVGRLLLLHRTSVHTEQKLARSERDRIYQGIYDKVIAGEITLQPHAELEVLQNMLLLYTRNGQLAEASQMFDRTFERLDQTGQMAPDVYASFLFSKARLMSSLSEREHSAEALRFIQASANALKESVANWRLCLKDALPLQERYGKFKLARTLNDFACDLRTLGQVSEAEVAIEESIQIKKANGALPHSLAISLSEYSQILTAQGKIRQAQPINEEAVEILERALAACRREQSSSPPGCSPRERVLHGTGRVDLLLFHRQQKRDRDGGRMTWKEAIVPVLRPG